MVTVIDVAQLAGVSPSTVSNVLNNPDRVREATRQRVLAAAETLGFQPNLFARSLRYGDSPFTAIIVSDSRLAYVAEVVRSAQEALAEAGRLALVLSTDGDAARLRASIDQLRAVGVKSFLLSPIPFRYSDSTVTYLRQLGQENLYFSLITNQMADTSLDVVTTGARDGSVQMVRHLVGLGHRRIAFVGPGRDRKTPGWIRVEGYLDGLAESGLTVRDDYIVDGPIGVETGASAVSHLVAMDERPTAVMASDDTIAAGVVQESHRRGIRVPQDWSVSGYNDEPIAGHIHPSLTTLAMAGTAAGKAAVELLIARMADNQLPLGRRHHIDYELVVRESTGPAPTG